MTAKFYSRYGTFMQEFSFTMPARRVVGNWPLQWLADRAAVRLRKRFGQRYSVRIKP